MRVRLALEALSMELLGRWALSEDEGIRPWTAIAIALMVGAATSGWYMNTNKAQDTTRPTTQGGALDNGPLMRQTFEVLAVAEEHQPCLLLRPCVDCGLKTGCYCDYCKAVDRLPDEQWAKGQMTPLCTKCDKKQGACHFCRGLLWCVPPPNGSDGHLGDGVYAVRR